MIESFGSSPLVEHAIRAQCTVAELDRVVVVLGAHAECLLERVAFGRAEPVVCADWHHGQAASLRCGVAALSGALKVIVTLGDQPLIAPRAIRAVRRLTGDRGARDLLTGPGVECAQFCSGVDVDTQADLREVVLNVRACGTPHA